MMQRPIHEMFRDAAHRFGGNVAIEAGDVRITYRELEERGDELAVRLHEAGIDRGAPVAILASRTGDVTAAILGTLRAGGVFMPLDRNFPTARLEAVVAEVRPRWWLVDPACAGPLEELRRRQGLEATIISVGAGGGRRPEPLPALELDPDGLAYVYFTSGSTARPKAIAGRLKAIDHFMRWEIDAFGIGEEARVSQLTSPAFDAFLRDIFVPLSVGGTVCAPVDREVVLDGARLAEWIDRRNLTLVHCTPSVFRSLLAQDLSPALFPALRHVLLAGEPLLPADVRRWRAVFGDRVELVNLYGPSETTLIKLFHRVRPEDVDAHSIPVGQPLPETRAVVVDDKGRPCPPGKLGEIYIRTPYRSLGYLNRPELTREVFVPNPFSGRPDDIVYKTGDLGRMRKDGSFEVIGRRDQQVKIRGVRVEIAPIEDRLRSHESVAEAAVVDRADTQGNRYLCAYVVPRGELQPAQLAGHLREHLPEPMIPSAFLRLDSLPRTLTGKVDRRALPDPVQLSRQHVSPGTPVEEGLCRLFTELLGIPRIGIDDNFFEIGGHSLLATLLLSRIRSTFGVEVPLHQVFRTPTVRHLAVVTSRLQAAGRDGETARPADEIAPQVAAAGPFPLSYPQQQLWLVDQVEGESPFYNVAAAVSFQGELNVGVLRQALAEVVRRHETLRSVFAVQDGQPVQVVQPPHPQPLSLVDLAALPRARGDEEARRLAVQEATRRFHLDRAPLLRCHLLRLGEGEHVITCVMHHIVSDWWSLAVLVRELDALYGAFRHGRPSPLPDLPLQYRDYAVWQRRQLDGETLDSALSYWRRQLASAPTFLPLPVDRPRPAVQSFRGAGLGFELPPEVHGALRDLAVQEGCSLFHVLLAAFQVLLRQLTGLDDVVVSAPSSGREREETQGLIGLFVRTLLFRVDLAGNPSFREVLARVRRAAAEAEAHRHAPLERVIQETVVGRDLGYSPLLQVSLNVVDLDPLAGVGASGLTVVPFPLETGSVQHELNLVFLWTPRGLQGRAQYRSDLFDEGTVALWMDQLQRLLDVCAREPDADLGSLREALATAGEDRLREVKQRLENASLQSLRQQKRQSVPLETSSGAVQ